MQPKTETCVKCGKVGETIQLPGESWRHFIEKGWTYAADGRYFCPKCADLYLKGEKRCN